MRTVTFFRLQSYFINQNDMIEHLGTRNYKETVNKIIKLSTIGISMDKKLATLSFPYLKNDN